MLMIMLLCLSVAENPFMTIISLFVQNALINNCHCDRTIMLLLVKIKR